MIFHVVPEARVPAIDLTNISIVLVRLRAMGAHNSIPIHDVNARRLMCSLTPILKAPSRPEPSPPLPHRTKSPTSYAPKFTTTSLTFLTTNQGVPSSQFLVQAQAGTEPSLICSMERDVDNECLLISIN
ncbi:hypothetical protein Hypma_013655 [Hypsizygus marmoreus]|uniref:Uncharacterized protein n=1 Tax=Hypsizygus marmoreus TaxID=39966 RepID=A0A369JKQ2_HYPMA|nr:hypothetical protein Hypma_013655 [Hypsizygus marmoreus]